MEKERHKFHGRAIETDPLVPYGMVVYANKEPVYVELDIGQRIREIGSLGADEAVNQISALILNQKNPMIRLSERQRGAIKNTLEVLENMGEALGAAETGKYSLSTF
ncbi:MAG: hypothetical protein NTU57_05735 [Candidatus Aenigmarchaeota archaeon]|nr:hypothetical protein [Candidatus Aenigmarchaeota archaeon]